MQKILVTTDFSTPSKAGLRFAVRLAAQMNAELIFFHCFQALIPTAVQRERIENPLQRQTADHLRKLEKFVAGVYRSLKTSPGAYRCVVVEDLNPGKAILEHARRLEAGFICISTRGAGGLGKILGTHTSSLLHKSPLPVLVVPHTYRIRQIKKVLYASDIENLETEMQIVCRLTGSMGVRTDLAHFYYLNELKPDPKTLAALWQRQFDCLDQVYLDRLDGNFAIQMNRLIEKIKPAVVVFFTHTNKNWFDRMFAASMSEAFSFMTNVPLLVYRKTSGSD